MLISFTTRAQRLHCLLPHPGTDAPALAAGVATDGVDGSLDRLEARIVQLLEDRKRCQEILSAIRRQIEADA
jgi:hypothetical protein